MTKQYKRNFQSAAELSLRAEVYFQEQTMVHKPFTLPGLARALGFSRRDTLLDYTKLEQHEQFHDAMAAARMRVEEWTAEKLYDKTVNVSGPIFALKNQGWGDEKDNKQAVHIKIEGVAATL